VPPVVDRQLERIGIYPAYFDLETVQTYKVFRKPLAFKSTPRLILLTERNAMIPRNRKVGEQGGASVKRKSQRPFSWTFGHQLDGGKKRVKGGFRRLFVESLEARQLMAANLIGTVYEDVDRNGIRNNGENGVAGWTAFLDLNNDNALTVGEPTSITNVDGDYQFNSIAAGTYHIGIVMQTGWVPTSPESLEVIVGTSGNVRANFYVFSGGDITGTIWNDLDQNGIRATNPTSGGFEEPGLEGWTVFLDLNTNNTWDIGEPQTLTDVDGKYRFLDLPPGDYEVFEVVPTSWDISPGFDNKQTAAVVSRTQYVLDFANFSTSNGGIQGIVFNDLNADGFRAPSTIPGEFLEPGIEGWTVFLDLNNNRNLDPTEPSTVTDTNGRYGFLSLLAGDYEVVESLPAGWDVSPLNDNKQTVAVEGGRITTASNFANFTTLNGSISGKVWNDINRNGIRDRNTLTGAFFDPPLAGWQIFVDSNRNHILDPLEPVTLTDANGNYAFLDLQVGDYEVQEVLPAGWVATTTFSDRVTVAVRSGIDTAAPDFANYNVTASSPGSIAGVVWNDNNGNGVRDVGDDGLAGWTVYLDSNNDSLLTIGESQVVTGSDGSYLLSNVSPGTVTVAVVSTVGWRASAPIVNKQTLSLRGSENRTGVSFGEAQLKESSISGLVFADNNKNGVRDVGERGLSGLTAYLDLNNNSQLDAGEPSSVTTADLFYTPTTDESGNYAFTHLAQGTYVVRHIVPALLSATPATELVHSITISGAEDRTGVNVAAVFRPNEIRGVKFDDLNGNHLRDPGEPGMSGITIFLDINRNELLDAGEPSTISGPDGSYAFLNLSPGKYVVRSIDPPEHEHTYPTTTGGTLWPPGTSNPAAGNVNPLSITQSLAQGQSYRQSVSITLPNTGALTNVVDVFLLFDDTGSFVGNSPIVRAAFPTIMTQLQASLVGIDLGFGVGRFEEYGNFGAEYATGRPFVLNQPIVAASTAGYQTAVQAALDRTTPGYGGDQPETDIEALFQVVTGRGFDGNNNGSVLDSGSAGLASTQLTPGNSGDVPSFASFTADPAHSVFPAAGNVGGAGFRAGALPIILLATDTGFAYQPKGESVISGVNGLTLPISSLTQTSRPTTPFNSGAGIQETITGLNALGALVIGLGTNPVATVDPRQQLESISKLTGATNRTTTTIANGTADPIAPGDPLYFQIATGFATSVANGVVSAIQNAVTNVAVDIDVVASDPRIRLINHTGILRSIGSGMTANFDIEFIGDGAPRRFDLQFVRAGTNVVLGSIPVVLGTPIPGDGYEFEDLEDGEIEIEDDFGSKRRTIVVNQAPTAVTLQNTTTTLSENSSTVSDIKLADIAIVDDGLGVNSLALSGADASHFKVVGNELFLKAGTSLQFATKPVYTLTIEVDDVSVGLTPDATTSFSLTLIAAANPTLAITSGDSVYSNSVYVASASITGSAIPAPTVSFEYYSDALGVNIISSPENVGTYYVRAISSANVANNAAQSSITPFQITPLAITGSISVTNKRFDGIATATILTRSLSGVLGLDDVHYIGGTASFETPDVGVNKAVTAIGLSLSGIDANNYTVNTTASTTANITPTASIASRKIFYNNAAGFGTSGINNSPLVNPINAIDPTRNALLPGETTSLSNYSNYSRGLNGLVVDINNPENLAGINATSFSFAIWNDFSNATPNFATINPAVMVSTFPTGGDGGSDRIKLTFDDRAIENAWLRITLLADTITGLAANDVFYFGNARFDVTPTTSFPVQIVVNAFDTNLVRAKQGLNAGIVSNSIDVDRNGIVNAFDTNAVRSGLGVASLRPFTSQNAFSMNMSAPVVQIRNISKLKSSLVDDVFAELASE
jgi:YDG domain/SdrD B-like domain